MVIKRNERAPHAGHGRTGRVDWIGADVEQPNGSVSYSVYAREDGRTRFTLIDAGTGDGKAADMPTKEAHRMFFFGWVATMQPRTLGGRLLHGHLLRKARLSETRR